MKPGLGKATPDWTSTRIKVIDINEVNRIAELLKKVDCTNYALISDVSKEMGIKKTALMQFIVDNPKLFSLIEVTKKGKSAGLGIKMVYLTADQNPDTEEWMKVKMVEWDHKLHVGGKYYYNTLEFWFFPEETSDSKESKYRNSRAKFEQLEEMGILKKTTQGYGGLSDYYKVDVYPCNTEILEKLANAGWTTDFDEVLAESKK